MDGKIFECYLRDMIRFDYFPEGLHSGLIDYNLRLELGVNQEEWDQIKFGKANIIAYYDHLDYKGSEMSWVNTAWNVWKMPVIFKIHQPAPDGYVKNVPNVMNGWSYYQP